MRSDTTAAATVASCPAEAFREAPVDKRHRAASDEAVAEELLANSGQQAFAVAGEVDDWWVAWVAAP